MNDRKAKSDPVSPAGNNGSEARKPLRSMRPEIGRLYGSYRIKGLLGEGGMGLVFHAEHIRLGRAVALKKLKHRYAQDPETVERFFAEARAVNQIDHPHIVEITDFIHEPNQAYYIMELLQGESLAAVLQREQRLSVRRALYIAYQVADTLAAAHACGVVHLDIKPSNIFLTTRRGQQDYVKLLDFGAAQLTADQPPPPAQTPRDRSGVAPTQAGPAVSGASPATSLPTAGTPVYMSPEQFTGEGIDARSDIYSLGAVLYELLSGNPPFRARTAAEYAYKHMTTPPPPLRKRPELRYRLDRSCEKVVERCLAKDPDDRFADAKSLRDGLGEAAARTGLRLAPGQKPHIMQAAHLGRALWIAAVALFVLGTVIGLGLYLALQTPARSDGAAGNQPKDHSANALHRKKTSSAAPTAGAARRASAGAQDARVQSRQAIALKVQSQPPGAIVERLTPEHKILGLTPLRLAVSPSSKTWILLVKKPNYRTVRLELAPEKDVERTVTLVALERSDGAIVSPDASRAPRKKMHRLSRDDKNGRTGRGGRKQRPRTRTRARRGRTTDTRDGVDDTTGTFNPFRSRR
jgi:serine/threonine-protein kinase